MNDQLWTRRYFLKTCATGLAVTPGILQSRAVSAAVSGRSTLAIACSNALAPASQIRDFLAAGDNGCYSHWGPFHVPFETLGSQMVQHWKKLRFSRILYEDLGLLLSPGVHIDSTGKYVSTDYSEYDRRMSIYVNTLKSRPLIELHDVPKPLSSYLAHTSSTANKSDGYRHISGKDDSQSSNHDNAELYSFTYMPNSLDDWFQYVKDLVSHNVQLGLSGLSYSGPPFEPEVWDSWRGTVDSSDEEDKLLEESIQLYATTCRAIKEADPRALVGGPTTMSWRSSWMGGWQGGHGLAKYGLREWLIELGKRMHRLPGVRLDFVSWQDYSGWGLSNGAAHVNNYLREAGFPASTAKVLGGSGFGSWCYGGKDWQTEQTDKAAFTNKLIHASYIAQSFIEEFRVPFERQFAAAYYYTFFMSDAHLADPTMDELHHSALMTGTAQAPKLTPMYGVFDMFARMTGGDIVETAGGTKGTVLATRDGTVIRAVINNNSPGATRFNVLFHDVDTYENQVKITKYTVNSPTQSGIGKPEAIWAEARNRNVQVMLDLLPFETTQLVLDTKPLNER